MILSLHCLCKTGFWTCCRYSIHTARYIAFSVFHTELASGHFGVVTQLHSYIKLSLYCPYETSLLGVCNITHLLVDISRFPVIVYRILASGYFVVIAQLLVDIQIVLATLPLLYGYW